MQNNVSDMHMTREEMPRLYRNLLHTKGPAWRTQPSHPVPGGQRIPLSIPGRTSLWWEREMSEKREELSPFLERRLEQDVQVRACTHARTCVSSYCFCVFISLISPRIFLSPSFCLLCVYSALLFLGSWGGSSDYWSETSLLMQVWDF